MNYDILNQLKNVVLEFDMENAEAVAKKAVEAGVSPLKAAAAAKEFIKVVQK